MDLKTIVEIISENTDVNKCTVCCVMHEFFDLMEYIAEEDDK